MPVSLPDETSNFIAESHSSVGFKETAHTRGKGPTLLINGVNHKKQIITSQQQQKCTIIIQFDFENIFLASRKGKTPKTGYIETIQKYQLFIYFLHTLCNIKCPIWQIFCSTKK